VPIIEGFLDEADCGGSTDGCLTRTVQQSIADGTIIIMMELGDVNSFTNDDSVTMQLYLGTVPDGATIMADGNDILTAGQTFDTDMMVGPQVTGEIYNGRLRISTPELTIMVDAGGFMLPLVVRNAEIRFDIAESSLTNGIIGGSLLNEDIIAAAMEFAPDQASLVAGFLSSVADMQPSAEDNRMCDAMSVGITFNAVDATRNP
jgi:hypothetical protein